MRDSPLHIAMLGDDEEHRVTGLTRMFAPLVPTQPLMLRADEDGTVVGVCGLVPPPVCATKALGSLPPEQFPPMSDDPAEQARAREWFTAWAARDPDEPHFHLGPVAADLPRQGEGIGTAMLTAFCALVDAEHAVAYLETDKPINVRFYERFGFEVVGEADVIGVPNWFMARAAR
jgi:RimJ/RimL family protein N-acetyltransferase